MIDISKDSAEEGAVKAIMNSQLKFKCHLYGFVTDNAANVTKIAI